MIIDRVVCVATCLVLQEAIAQLSSSNSTDEERHDALVAMQMLVEPIDNANGEGSSCSCNSVGGER
jgi:hypothetical protein